eukprot:g5948.t1
MPQAPASTSQIGNTVEMRRFLEELDDKRRVLALRTVLNHRVVVAVAKARDEAAADGMSLGSEDEARVTRAATNDAFKNVSIDHPDVLLLFDGSPEARRAQVGTLSKMNESELNDAGRMLAAIDNCMLIDELNQLAQAGQLTSDRVTEAVGRLIAAESGRVNRLVGHAMKGDGAETFTSAEEVGIANALMPATQSLINAATTNRTTAIEGGESSKKVPPRSLMLLPLLRRTLDLTARSKITEQITNTVAYGSQTARLRLLSRVKVTEEKHVVQARMQRKASKHATTVKQLVMNLKERGYILFYTGDNLDFERLHRSFSGQSGSLWSMLHLLMMQAFAFSPEHLQRRGVIPQLIADRVEFNPEQEVPLVEDGKLPLSNDEGDAAAAFLDRLLSASLRRLHKGGISASLSSRGQTELDSQVFEQEGGNDAGDADDESKSTLNQVTHSVDVGLEMVTSGGHENRGPAAMTFWPAHKGDPVRPADRDLFKRQIAQGDGIPVHNFPEESAERTFEGKGGLLNELPDKAEGRGSIEDGREPLFLPPLFDPLNRTANSYQMVGRMLDTIRELEQVKVTRGKPDRRVFLGGDDTFYLFMIELKRTDHKWSGFDDDGKVVCGEGWEAVLAAQDGGDGAAGGDGGAVEAGGADDNTGVEEEKDGDDQEEGEDLEEEDSEEAEGEEEEVLLADDRMEDGSE